MGEQSTLNYKGGGFIGRKVERQIFEGANW